MSEAYRDGDEWRESWCSQEERQAGDLLTGDGEIAFRGDPAREKKQVKTLPEKKQEKMPDMAEKGNDCLDLDMDHSNSRCEISEARESWSYKLDAKEQWSTLAEAEKKELKLDSRMKMTESRIVFWRGKGRILREKEEAEAELWYLS